MVTQIPTTTIAQIWNTQAPHVTALEAARRFHLSVIPLDADKRPSKVGGTHADGTPKRLAWKKYQTECPHEKQINHWQRTLTPLAWAVVTGTISNIIIIDWDGEQGEETRRKLGLPSHVKTGSGGSHTYFQHPGWHVPTLNSKSKKEMGQRWPGLDIRADGGYAAFCGRNEQGPYTWLRDFQPEKLEILPDDLRLFLGLMYSPDEMKARQERATKSTRVEGDKLLTKYVQEANFRGRDNAGFELACQLRDNDFSESSARSIMLEYARRVPSTNTKDQYEPFTDEEALAKLASAYTRPARQPWESTLSPEQIYPPTHPNQNGNGSNSNGSGPAPTDNAYRSFNLTDLGNAERLVSRFGRDLRYCHDMKAWLTWNITQWKEDKDGHAERIAKKVVRLIYKEAGDVPGDDKESEARRKALASHAMRSESKKVIRDMLELAKSEEGVPIRREDLDADPWLLNCSNGTVDLHTGTRQEHNRNDYITRCITTRFNPDARCPLWLATIETIFNHNAKLIRFFKRAMGYALTGDTSEQCFFLLYGKGNNGKSTLLEVIQAILGDYAQAAEFKAFLSRDNEGIRNDIARMNGKRLIIAKETDKGKRLAEALVKQLTGGDTITARFLHQEYFDFKPQFKLFLAANYKPEIKGTDLGIWRRVRLIPFEVTIPDAEKDKDLPKKLLQEAEGILAWLIEGCLEWQREGLGVPDVVQEATSTYREEMDSVTKFLSTQCEFAEGFKIPSSELFETYIEWCQGDRPDVKQLKNVLRERGLKNARSTGGRYVWHGIQLKPVESEPSQDKSEPSQDQSEGKSEHSEGSEPKKGNLFHESENLQELPKTSSLGSLVHSEVHYEYYQERAGKLEQAGKHRPLEPCPSCSTDNWYPHWQTAEKVWESGWAWGCATCNPGIVMEVH